MHGRRGAVGARIGSAKSVALVFFGIPSKAVGAIDPLPRVEQGALDASWMREVRRLFQLLQLVRQIPARDGSNPLKEMLMPLAEHHDQRPRHRSMVLLSRILDRNRRRERDTKLVRSARREVRYARNSSPSKLTSDRFATS